MEKQFKSFKEQHDEEHFTYIHSEQVPDATMSDIVWDNGICVKLKNEDIVYIKEHKLQTIFPFPYSADIKGDYESKLKEAENIVNLNYAITVNTKPYDFILEHLKSKPNLDLGALYLVREDQRLPENTRFKKLMYLRTYPDKLFMGIHEIEQMVLLKDADDRKALYSAYKKIRSNIVKQLTEWENQYKHNAFEIVMYNTD